MPRVTEGFTLTPELLKWFDDQDFDIDVNRRTVAFIDYYAKRGYILNDWITVWKKWILRDSVNPRLKVGRKKKEHPVLPGSLRDVEYAKQAVPMPDFVREAAKKARTNAST